MTHAEMTWLPRPEELPRLDTDQLRAAFLVSDLFTDGELHWRFTDLDRLAVGGAVATRPVRLGPVPLTGTGHFLERRELGVINIGGPGTARVDSRSYTISPRGCLYVGRGSREVELGSADPREPAAYYLLSCPAHQTHPTAVASCEEANRVPLGSRAQANERVIHQYIHPNGIPSCQLVMGFTELAEGSVWNTMPPHTHGRRAEVYFYFDLGEHLVVHLLGPPQATRHLLVRDREAVLSPAWSMHAGCGTACYRFIWGMAGENMVFDDMDKLGLGELR